MWRNRPPHLCFQFRPNVPFQYLPKNKEMNFVAKLSCIPSNIEPYSVILFLMTQNTMLCTMLTAVHEDCARSRGSAFRNTPVVEYISCHTPLRFQCGTLTIYLF